MVSGSRRSKRPNVVLVTDSLECGGAERVMSDMANYWVNQGWSVTLATFKNSESSDFYRLDSDVRRVRLSNSVSRNGFLSGVRSTVGIVRRLRALLRASRPDAVLSFIDVPNVLTILAAMGLNLRVIVSERGCPEHQSEEGEENPWAYPLSRNWRRLRRRLYSRAALVIALNKDAAAWIRNECGIDVSVIPNGIRDFPVVANERQSVVLAVGRLHPVKGFDLLIEAFAKLSPRFPQWRLVIVGDGNEKFALRRLCEELQLSDNVEFLGPIEDVETQFSRAGLVVVPSRSEAFGNVILESMATGAAVVSTECSGPLSIIEHDVNGRLVPVGDLGVLEETMAELMSQPALRTRLGNEARKVRRRYRQELIMELWEECLFPGGGKSEVVSSDKRGGLD